MKANFSASETPKAAFARRVTAEDKENEFRKGQRRPELVFEGRDCGHHVEDNSASSLTDRQSMQQTIGQIRDKLLSAVDRDYNVINESVVMEVISQLENYAITKEGLESTRLGKHINELRRKAANKALASRAKNLVKKWRNLLMPSAGGGAPAAAASTAAAPLPSTGSVPNNLNSATSATTTQRKVSPPATNSNVITNNSRIPKSASEANLKAAAGASSSSNNLVRNNYVNENTCSNVTTTSNRISASSSSRPSSSNTGPDLEAAKARPTGQKRTADGVVKNQVNGYHHPNLTNGGSSRPGSRPTTPKLQTNSSSLHSNNNDLLKQQIQSARRLTTPSGGQSANGGPPAAKKIRTTKEILEDLKVKRQRELPLDESSNGPRSRLLDSAASSLSNGSSLPPSRPGSPNSRLPTPDGGRSSSAGTVTPVNNNRTGDSKKSHHRGFLDTDPTAASISEVMSALPVIDAEEVLAEMRRDFGDEDDDEVVDKDFEDRPLAPEWVPTVEREISDKEVTKLHVDHSENVNGNFDSQTGDFKEWHEVVAKETLGGDLLYVLPYSIID